MSLKAPIITVLAWFLAILPASITLAAFNPVGDVCTSAPSSPTCQQVKAQNSSGKDPALHIIQAATNIIAAVAGVAAVIIVVVSGIMFVTAGGATPGQRAGDPNRIKSARSALTGALIGLVIIALAWTIVTFVTNKFIKT